MPVTKIVIHLRQWRFQYEDKPHSPHRALSFFAAKTEICCGVIILMESLYVNSYGLKNTVDSSKGCPLSINFQHPNWVSLQIHPRCLIGYVNEAFVVPETKDQA